MVYSLFLLPLPPPLLLISHLFVSWMDLCWGFPGFGGCHTKLIDEIIGKPSDLYFHILAIEKLALCHFHAALWELCFSRLYSWLQCLTSFIAIIPLSSPSLHSPLFWAPKSQHPQSHLNLNLSLNLYSTLDIYTRSHI